MPYTDSAICYSLKLVYLIILLREEGFGSEIISPV